MLLYPGLAPQVGSHGWGHGDRPCHGGGEKAAWEPFCLLKANPIADRLYPHPRLKPPSNPRPIGTLAINYAARLNLGPPGTPNRSARYLALGSSRPQSTAVSTGAALSLGGLGGKAGL